jgi:hypothetical protein
VHRDPSDTSSEHNCRRSASSIRDFHGVLLNKILDLRMMRKCQLMVKTGYASKPTDAFLETLSLQSATSLKLAWMFPENHIEQTLLNFDHLENWLLRQANTLPWQQWWRRCISMSWWAGNVLAHDECISIMNRWL